MPTRTAHSEDEAVAAAREAGYPIVLKLLSHTITHKTDVGGVQLNLQSEDAARIAYRQIEQSVAAKAGREHFQGVTVQPMVRQSGYEVILGSSIDAQFGPVMLFGSGGRLVEVYQDRALALPPLTTTLARRMMEQTKIYRALQGVRGRRAVDLGALESLLVRFSRLVVEQKWIKEIDVNPLLASDEGIVALDARVVLHPLETLANPLPRPAIRPYPVQYASPWKMKDGTEVLIRPIRPEDEPLMVEFHRTLSERSVYMRYFQFSDLSHRTTHERLTRICFSDYDRNLVLVAIGQTNGREPRIMAVGRLSKLHGRNEAEFALLVSDLYQRRGLGTELLHRLTEIGRQEKLHRIEASILRENQEMQTVARRLGYAIHDTGETSVVSAAQAL